MTDFGGKRRQVDEIQRNFHVLVHALPRGSVGKSEEHRAESFVTCRDALYGAVQLVLPKLSAQTECHVEIIGRAARIEPVEEPELLLSKG
ncbi:hypothetical protein GCM10017771_45160 [Streptomyces capitiformicae]|uniref:Uncharacterized protein n=1 Tax=Streptomyces capitiformicae TaxID=2014920 RepID=A0A919DAK7_9ACTN|nr:hypothetical protein GCM10017771_45160 [Streptomyces capitiformicae]